MKDKNKKREKERTHFRSLSCQAEQAAKEVSSHKDWNISMQWWWFAEIILVLYKWEDKYGKNLSREKNNVAREIMPNSGV